MSRLKKNIIIICRIICIIIVILGIYFLNSVTTIKPLEKN